MTIKFFADGHMEEYPRGDLLTRIYQQSDTGRFLLQRHWFRGQIVIRFGPSSEHYDLRLIKPGGQHVSFILKDDPRGDKSVAAFQMPGADHPKLRATDGEEVDAFKLLGRVALKPEPDKPDVGNPTIDTPAWVETVAQGKVDWLEDSDDFKKLNFHGKGFSGLWTLTHEEPGSDFWAFNPSTGPEISKAVYNASPNFGVMPGLEIGQLPAPNQLGYGTEVVPPPNLRLPTTPETGATPSNPPAPVPTTPSPGTGGTPDLSTDVRAAIALLQQEGYEVIDPKTNQPVQLKKTATGLDVETDGHDQEVTRTVRLFKADRRQRIIYGVVMEPDEVDTQGHFATTDQISDAQHYYALNWLLIDEEHQRVVPRTQAAPVEIFCAPIDIEWPIDDEGNVEVIKKGSWVQATKIFDDDLWAKYEQGDLNAYSIRGWGRVRGGQARDAQPA